MGVSPTKVGVFRRVMCEFLSTGVKSCRVQIIYFFLLHSTCMHLPVFSRVFHVPMNMILFFGVRSSALVPGLGMMDHGCTQEKELRLGSVTHDMELEIQIYLKNASFIIISAYSILLGEIECWI